MLSACLFAEVKTGSRWHWGGKQKHILFWGEVHFFPHYLFRPRMGSDFRKRFIWWDGYWSKFSLRAEIHFKVIWSPHINVRECVCVCVCACENMCWCVCGTKTWANQTGMGMGTVINRETGPTARLTGSLSIAPSGKQTQAATEMPSKHYWLPTSICTWEPGLFNCIICGLNQHSHED